MEKKHRSSGFTIVAVTRDSKKDKALAVATKAGVEFPVVNGGTLPGISEQGFPKYVLYDRQGQILEQQDGANPANEDSLSPEIHAAIDKALGESAAVLSVPLDEFKQKSVIQLAKRASAGTTAPGKILVQSEELEQQGTESEKAEAARLKAAILDYAERMKKLADEAKETAPYRRLDMLKQLAKEFRGHAVGEEAEAAHQAIKADDAAMADVESSRLLAELKQAKAPEKAAILKKLKKKYPDSRFTKEAEVG